MAAKRKNAPDPVISRLRALAHESPDLKDAARVYEAVLPLLRDVDLAVGTISLTPEEASVKMGKGEPLLPGMELDLDGEAVGGLLLRLAAAVERTYRPGRLLRLLRGPQGTELAARKIRLALERKELDSAALIPHIAAGVSGPITAAAERFGLDPDLLLFLAQNALKPALRAWRVQADPLAKGLHWDRGICFVCGAAASLAELQQNEQEKHLRCGACGADWRVPRLRCARCGADDHRALVVLYAEQNQGRMRIEACDRCRGYIKVIAAFSPTAAELLPVEDLATLHLDHIAKERGYEREGVLHGHRSAAP